MRLLIAASLAAACMWSAPASASAVFDCRACETSQRFYDLRAGALSWTGPANAHHLGALVRAVEGAQRHGLRAADYHLAELAAADAETPDERIDRLATDAYITLAAHLLSGRVDPVSIEPNWTAARRERDLAAYLHVALTQDAVEESLEGLAPASDSYRALMDMLERYRALEAAGGWARVDEGGVLRPGDRGARVAQMRARLAASGDLAEADAQSEDPELFDSALEAAVRGFQRRLSLEPDGVVGARTLAQLNTTPAQRINQLRANMERWRWLPEDLGERHIRVNIADFTLEARAGGVVEQRHDVIVGRLFRRTPVFSASMTYFVLNPWWETPPSLTVRDKLPAFRNDPGSVERLGFQVIDRQGQLVDPSTIDWHAVPAQNFPYRVRQAPGPLNALGVVKFMFPNRHNVYIHDTPTRGLFARVRRDFSSGCIRVHDPMRLADWVAAETPDFTPERMRTIVERGNETRVSLRRPVMVHILYLTAVSDAEAGVRFVDDLYERDGGLIAALDAAAPRVE
ncbi:L,D-transpeptidase family protein [Alkalicaulis satelles]|uniref:L,D-transpeptidase family protein n=1 Tax=Alkalicaulis satelles TaxID=2609175 RepID=A0A5M6ZGW1_9PROT|nr:L,D-transpeptidase family protein [Alkalicaulis satelles]KAA5804006.1 L,D-transpeptidase family protein [Alkalicaulis satelles]